MPEFKKLYAAKRKAGLLILAVNVQDPREKLDAYLRQTPLSFPVLLDSDGALTRKLGVQAFPTTVLVRQDGKVLLTVVGLDPSYLEFMVNYELDRKGGSP